MNDQNANRRPRILLVEDNPDDVSIFRNALKTHHLDWHLTTVENVDAAMEYLAFRNDRSAPDLLITAILLRERSGHELIAWARTQPHLKHLPILVISDAPNPWDRERALELGANEFMEKSADLGSAILAIRRFLPPHGPPPPQNSPGPLLNRVAKPS